MLKIKVHFEFFTQALLQWLYNVFTGKQNQPMEGPSWWKVPRQSPLVKEITPRRLDPGLTLVSC